MAVLSDLASYLQAQGLGTLASTIFLYQFPMESTALTSVQDACLALITVPGFASSHTHDGLAWENPVVQVLIRGLQYGFAAAEARATAAFLALDGLHNQTLSGTPYLWIFALHPPFFLKEDAYGRPILAFSVRVAKGVP